MRAAVVVVAVAACSPRTALDAPAGGHEPWLREGAHCMTCHDRITTQTGEDVSFGSRWRASIMANSARDPYFQAAVRRELLDHPSAAAEIEDSCSRCHMPMANERARAAGVRGRVFANLDDALALDGVACSVCHQIAAARLGAPDAVNGAFVIEAKTWPTMFGPFDIEPTQTSIMRSALGVTPARGDHIRRSELCATCHTLYTKAIESGASFPEQVPYLEWQQSEFRDRQSCQDCHMPEVTGPVAISSVAPKERDHLALHDFRGANFFVLGMLDRFRDDLEVTAPSAALEAVREATRTFLEQATARVSVTARREGDTVRTEVTVENLAGHKLPTAYPSRRAWLHVAVRDSTGRTLFESGRLAADGSIVGNDNDVDSSRYERHHVEIRTPDDVQIYEPILGTADGAVTTALLSTTQYLKDNRLLPRGFDKARASADTAVHGEASTDPDFVAGGDRTSYVVEVGQTAGPLTIEAELLFQPIGFRWAHNLDAYRAAAEPRRFVTYYNEMATGTAHRLASGSASIP